MHISSLDDARKNCHWLTLAGSLLILTVTIALTLLRPSGSQALDSGDKANLVFLPGNYQSPQHCRECHAEKFQAWSNTTHADASFDPVFQVSLQKAAEPGQCFICHTTGYDSVTGRFVLAGVTCEACHGPYRPEHPQESMVIAASEDLCGTCHTATVVEWTSSYHAQAGVTCADCHEVHTQKTRVAHSTHALCAGCHREQTRSSVHATHNLGETGVHCVDCHLARPSADAEDMVRGQAATGHSFGVFVSTCSDCHATPEQLPTGIP
jgi:hypothetical protein